MDTALETVEELTCLYLKAETAERTYSVRDGYSVVYLDPFTTITSVKVDGDEIEYTPAFWDNQNATVRNSIIIDKEKNYKEVTVSASWVIPDDLQALIDKLDTFLATSKSSRIKSKKVEDFSITLNDKTDMEQFADDNRALINKYSICNVINVTSGKVYDRCC